MNLTILNFPKLLEIYAVANTASYLYRHYKSDTNVITFSRTYNSAQLVTLIKANIAKEIETITTEDIVYSYAALAALSHQPSNEAVSAMEGADLTNLRWGKKLWDICRNSYITSVVFKLDLPQKKGKLEPPIIGSDISASIAYPSFAKSPPQIILSNWENASSVIRKIGETHD